VRPSADNRESGFEFETLLADVSSRFINLPPADVHREIENAQRRVCELLGIELSVLWQWSVAAPGVITPTHIYQAQGALQIDQLSEEQFPWLRQQMLAGCVVAIASLKELPAAAAVDRENCSLFDIKSNLTIPLAVGGGPPVGALAFNTTRAERAWPDAVVTRLQLVAQVFTNALARKRHELELHESEERLRLAADSAEAGLWTLDYGTRIFWVTARAREIFGYSPDEVISLERFEASVHPDDRDLVRGVIDQALHERDPLNVEYRILLSDGRARWIASRGRPQFTFTGELERLMGISVDITERKRTDDELRDLSRRLIRAHEDERALLARELHDDVTQRLAVLAIDVGRAESTAPDVAQAEAMRSVREGLVRLSEDVHTLAYQLHPSVLEELGLAEALRTECERIGRQSRVELRVALDPLPAVVGKDEALCLFRVAQEALNNVTRHAGARAASVALRQMDGGLLLAVRDDGVGFDPASPGKGRSLGLASMRERVRLVNGTLDIESAPGRGTEIVVWVPTEGEAR